MFKKAHQSQDQVVVSSKEAKMHLPKLMTCPTAFQEITKSKLNHNENVGHDIVQYGDHSSKSNGGETVESLGNYTKDYIKLLKLYCKANKLRIN